jgi:hypothetical protein
MVVAGRRKHHQGDHINSKAKCRDAMISTRMRRREQQQRRTGDDDLLTFPQEDTLAHFANHFGGACTGSCATRTIEVTTALGVCVG